VVVYFRYITWYVTPNLCPTTSESLENSGLAVSIEEAAKEGKF